MKWFGRHWGAEVCDGVPHVAAPVDMKCAFCTEAIGADDRGFLVPFCASDGMRELAYHLDCHMRTIVGSVAHQQRRCSCYGGTEEDPPEMTLRQAARAACELWDRTRNRPRWN